MKLSIQPRLGIAILVLAAGALLAGLLGRDLYLQREATIDATRDRTQELAKLLEEHARQNLQQVDLILTAAAGAVAEQREAGRIDIQALRRQLHALLPQDHLVRALNLIDQDGKPWLSTLEVDPTSLPNLSKRDFFASQREHASLGMFVGTPTRSEATGTWSLPATVRLSAKDGAFLGVLLATIEPAVMQRYYASINTGANGFITLFDHKGWIVARAPHVEAIQSRNWAHSPMFREHLAQAATGTVRQIVLADGVDRIYSYRTLADFPFIISAGLSVSDALAPWRRQAWRDSLMLLLFLSALAAVALTLLRQLRRREANEKALRRQAAILDKTTDIVSVAAVDGQYLFLNAAGRRRLNIGLDEDITLYNTLRWYTPEQWRHVLEVVRPAAVRDGGWSGENRIAQADGRQLVVSQVLMPNFDASGQPESFSGIARDITEQIEAQSAAQEREARLAGLIDRAIDAIISINEAQEIVLFNPAAEKMFGYQAGAMLGRKLEELIPAGARVQHLVDVVKFAADEGGSRQMGGERELKGLHADGSEFAIEAAIWRIKVKDGWLMTAMVRDITARKQAEQAARESSGWLRLAVQSANIGLWDWDLRSGLTTYSHEWKSQLGYQEHEIGNQAGEGSHLVHPDDLARRQACYEAYLAHPEGVLEDEFRMLHKDGTWRWIYTCGNFIRDANGVPVRMMGCHLDITDRKQAERQRQELEGQLRQAQKMEALGTLSGGIAHDFNNILAAILGNVALAREDAGADNPAQQSLDEIAKAGQRARDLVQQILAFSRQQPQRRDLLDLRQVAGDAIKLLRASLPANIALESHFAAQCPGVLGDRTQLHQVLMNLGTNAWHAMGAQGGRIEVALEAVQVSSQTPDRATPLDSGLRRNDTNPVVPAQAGTQTLVTGINLPSGLYLHLSVKDNGKGMDAGTMARIFDPFFTTKAPGEGTGLGLSVVDGIVKGHGGAINCYSQVGVGSSFHLYLPAQQQQAQAPVPEPSPSQGKTGKGQRILFLDDEEALVFMSTRLLERLGYQVAGFTQGEQALAAFQADPQGFDLLVTDYNMPGPSGLDVAGQMLEIRPELPVALASGYVTDELREKAAALGIQEVLYKPTAVEGLIEAIDRMLGGAHPAGTQTLDSGLRRNDNSE